MNKKQQLVNVKRTHCDVYIGRPSIWGNPFIEGRDGTRDQVIEKYEKYIRMKPSLMKQLPLLKGKVLGCWCTPKHCHGEILLKLIDEVCKDE